MTFGDVCYHRTFDPLHQELLKSNGTVGVKMEIGVKPTMSLKSHRCHREGRGWGTREGSCHERANASYPWVPQKGLGNTCSAMSPVKAQSRHPFSISSILIAHHLGPQLEPEPDPRGKNQSTVWVTDLEKHQAFGKRAYGVTGPLDSGHCW